MRSFLDPFFKLLGGLGALFIFATLAVEVFNIAGRQLGFSMAGMEPTRYCWLPAPSWRWATRCAAATISASP